MSAQDVIDAEANAPVAEPEARAPAIEGPGDAPAGDGDEHGAERRGRLVAGVVLGLLLVPLAVSAVGLALEVRGDYLPAADHALTELQIRDVGHRGVLTGLYSRADWSHPGPALFYLLAPFYWLAGGASVAMHLGALAINGGAIAAMAALARRRGGLPLMLCVAVAIGLTVRTLGAEFVADPWNCYVTVLPFGLLVLLVWSATCGEGWAVVAAAVVASCLAQTHVGFVILALPLLGWAVVGWALPALRSGDAEGRKALRPAVTMLALLAVLWLPPALDAALNDPTNLGNIVEWFRRAEGGTKTVAEGWRVVTAQFGGWPEWLTVKRDFSLTGESVFLTSSPLPWLLVPVVAAGVVLWRRRAADDRRLVVTLALVLVLSIVAVARTVGLAFDYRLRWTWIAPMLAVAVAAWVAWRFAAERWPRAEGRWLVPAALVALVAVTAVNSVTAASFGRPREGDSGALAAIVPPVLTEVGDLDGPVEVTDVYDNGAWFQRGVVLALERHGVDVRVPAQDAEIFGDHRVLEGRASARLVVAEEHVVDVMAEKPGLRMVADWWDDEVTPAEVAAADERSAAVEGRLAAGEIDEHEALVQHRAIGEEMRAGAQAVYYRVAVFLEE